MRCQPLQRLGVGVAHLRAVGRKRAPTSLLHRLRIGRQRGECLVGDLAGRTTPEPLPRALRLGLPRKAQVVGVPAVVGAGIFVCHNLHRVIAWLAHLDHGLRELLFQQAVLLVVAPRARVVAVAGQDAVPRVLAVAFLVVALLRGHERLQILVGDHDVARGALLLHQRLGDEHGVEHVVAQPLGGIPRVGEEVRPARVVFVVDVFRAETLDVGRDRILGDLGAIHRGRHGTLLRGQRTRGDARSGQRGDP